MARHSDGSDPLSQAAWFNVGGVPTAGYSGPLTIAFWVKAVLSQPDAVILNHKGSFHADQEWSIVFQTSDNSIRFHSSTSSAPGTDSQIILPDANWHHVAYRRAAGGASEWAKFIDGVKTVINASLNFTLPSGADSRIACFNHSMPSTFPLPFNGDLMDMFVEKRALSDANIAALASEQSYATVNPDIDPDLCEFYLRMCDDGNVVFIIDFSGNGRHFDISDQPIEGSSSPTGLEAECGETPEPPPDPSEERVYRYAVDWDNDGDFDDANEIISGYVVKPGAWWERGQRNPEPGAFQAGQAGITLDNSTGIFSSFNEASPLYGLILPRRLVSITMQIGEGPEEVQWVGYLDSLVPTVGAVVGVSTAELRAVGPLSLLTDVKVSIPMQENITTGAAAILVLEAAGIDAADYEVDTGQTTMARWWVPKDTLAIDAMRELAAAECGTLGESKDGKILFRDRAHYQSETVRATYGVLGGLMMWRPRQEDHLRAIYNRVETKVRTFNITDTIVLATVSDVRNGEGGTPPIVPAGGSLTLEIAFPDEKTPANYLAVHEWGGDGIAVVDLESNTQADAQGTDNTADITPTLEEFADRIRLTFANSGGSDGHLIKLRVNGSAVVEDTPVEIPYDDGPSQADFRVKLFPNPSEWLTHPLEADDYAAHILALWKDPHPRLLYDVMGNYNADHLLEVQRRDVGHYIRVAAGAPYGLGIDTTFSIEFMHHAVDEAKTHIMSLIPKAVVEHDWPASDYPRDSIVTTDEGPPDQIRLYAADPGLRITVGIEALKWNHSIFEAEIRAQYYASGSAPAEVDMRLASEGGTWTPNGTTARRWTGLGADHNGTNLRFTSADPGVWFIAGRLRNIRGWSVWSDGNAKPRHVKYRVATEDESLADSGPPSDWDVLPIEPGPTEGTVIGRATRPRTNGNKILFVLAQIKDVSTGSSRYIDEDAGAADTIYDGSAISHTYNKIAGTLVKESGGNFPALTYGDLILFDVRGGAFDRQHCQWATLQTVPTGDTMRGLFAFRPDFEPTLNEYADIRIKVVRPITQWTTEGYLGGEPNHGLWERSYYAAEKPGDRSTAVFTTDPIQLPSGLDIENCEIRFWFENFYSRADDDKNHSTGVAGKAAPDTEPPGALVELLVTGGMGTFTATWKDPLTGNKTLTKIAEQYSTDPDFDTSPPSEVVLFDYDNFLSGRARNRAYYFRFSAQNQSGINDASLSAEDVAMLNALGSAFVDGWGPWTYANDGASPESPDLIQSGPAYVLTDADTVTVDLSKGTYFLLVCDEARADRALEFINPDPLRVGFLIEIQQSGAGGHTVDVEAEQTIVYTQQAQNADLDATADAITKLGFVYHEDGASPAAPYYRLDAKTTPL